MILPALVFATNNAYKVAEIRLQIGHLFQVISLKDAGIVQEIPEPFDTLRENASEKSRVISELTGGDCFSEDTGLEVDALNGAPGVKSARYAGENADSEQNITKLLDALQGETNRKARFHTVISLRLQGQEYFFEGICNGTILTGKTGNGGFGYDPVFMPEGFENSFAELSLAQKAAISHRGLAVAKLLAFLNQKMDKTEE